MLTDHDISLVRASYALAVRHEQAVADLFYDRLFAVAPHLRALFPADLAEQKGKLMSMVGSAIGGLDDARFIPALKALGARHAGYGVTMEHYAIAGDALLWTLQQVLGERFTLNFRSAWIKVYGIIAMTMVAGGAEAVMPKAA